MSKQKYQVGSLAHFQQSDPIIEGYDKAVKHAMPKSKHGDMGIWTTQKKGSDLVAIVHEGEIFRK